MMKYILLALFGVMCFIGGVLIMGVGQADNIVGTLRVDRSDKDGPYIFAEFEKPIEYVARQKLITLKVEDKDYIKAASETLRIK